MNYTTVTNLQWSKNGDAINCVVNFESLGEVPFAARPDDNYAHGREIYARCVAGEFGPIGEYVFEIDEGPNPQATGEPPKIPSTVVNEVL